MTTSKGRIAQTFPDINSSGLTVATAAGVRSFPEPFIAIPGGVDVRIQNATGTIAAGASSVAVALGTGVDVTRSFIQYRGCNVLASDGLEPTSFFNRMNFTSIVGSISSEVTIRRNHGGFPVYPAVDYYFTTVTFEGTNTDSGDIRVEDGSVSIASPSTGGDIILAGPQLTAGELLRSFCFIRGVEFIRQPPILGDPCSAGTGTACWKHPEQWHGDVRLVNSGPDTVIRYSRFTPGSTIGPDHCGTSNVDVYATAVIFP